MFSISFPSRLPVYEQIVKQTEEYLLKGILTAGDKMPSVRNLSVKLSVNPNTIQKAYGELDARGIIYTVPGKGCFICNNALDQIKTNKLNTLDDLRKMILDYKTAGVSKAEIQRIVNEAFEGEGK